MTQPPDSTPDQPPQDPSTPPSYPTYPAGAGQPQQPSQQPGTPPPGGEFPPPPGAYPPPAAGAGYPPPQQYAGGPQQTNQLALWSMITGIVALVLGVIGACGVIFGPVAIGLALPGKRQIAASHGMQKGDGMATAGLIMGSIGAVISVVWIILIATGQLELPEF